MAAEQESEALRRAILDLPPEQREVILLHHSEDLSQREIAERLGVHQATVSRHLARALRALRGTLEPVLRREALVLRPSPRAMKRMSALIASVAALSKTAQAALAASGPMAGWTGSGGMAPQGAATGTGIAGLWELLNASLIAGGKIMATGKGITATLGAAAAIAGGSVYMSSGSDVTAPSASRPDVRPTMEIVRPELGPNAEATDVPRLDSEEALERSISTLGEGLAQGRFPAVPANATLFVHGTGAELDRFEFNDWSLASPPGGPLFPRVSRHL